MGGDGRGPGLFPYEIRPAQHAIIQAVDGVSRSGGALLMDSPTGSGKTIAILAPLIHHAIEASHRVIYLVRTHSQANQVIAETRAISKHSGTRILAVTLGVCSPTTF